MQRRTLLAAGVAVAVLPARAQAGEITGTGGVKLDVPFGPTGFAVTHAMLQVAGVTAQDFLIDLGSGDGRINIIAARDFGTRGEGYELDPGLVKLSRELAAITGVADKVRFVEADLFKADVSRASVVALYLGPFVTPRVAPKLFRELAPGTRIVSNNFTMGTWKPDLTLELRGQGGKVFFWWVPVRIAGLWRAQVALPDAGRREYRLDLRQTWQEADGEVDAGSTVHVQMRDLRIEGRRASFLLQEQGGGEFTFRRFLGHVEGDVMTGHFRSENPPRETPVRFERTVRAAVKEG